ncbi:MAG: glycosyl hydrolase 115 family protein [Bacteroidetes bacterium]|nr:glycosyl hydrolase 115 family protein [Bacteroidota bacterium]
MSKLLLRVPGISFLLLLIVTLRLPAQDVTGLPATLVYDSAVSAGDFPLVDAGGAAVLEYDGEDYKGVIRAAGDLKMDIERVTGVREGGGQGRKVIIGTIGKSRLVDGLVKKGKLDVGEVKGKWESFVIQTIKDVNGGPALVIAGSDKRGTIYGIYELSRQLGVSPWYWWADVPVRKRPAAWVAGGRYVCPGPKVRYRGIFINDEAPCFTGWSKEKFGGRNSKMYVHLFELLLRLRANYFWPAMWSSAFNEDDPDNPRLADEYGIVMGTSHHEPMLRSQQEWGRNRKNYGNGEWNYVSNKQGIQQFWRDGLQRNKNYESILTMGMRGDGDKPMPDAGSAAENFKVLEGIMDDQRKIVSEVTGKPASQTPQVWALYSEVLDYYDQGMKIPDDMTVLLCDDNWGDVRRLPELGKRKHPGGYGIYYHVDLHGAPRAYQWLNMTQVPHMWEQLQLTYSYGVDRVWILNVGDLKPMEYPMSFFLDMAWNPGAFTAGNISGYGRGWCREQFGPGQAGEAARILDAYCKYNSRVTAEMLNDKTYNLATGEFLGVRNEYMALEAEALRQFLTLPDSARDAYKELVLHPVQAMANLYDLYYSLAMDKKLAGEKDTAANFWADRVEYCFKRDAELSYDYNHKIAGGKWNHMMDQTHIGYVSWDEPRGGNKMPAVVRVKAEDVRNGGYVFDEKNGVAVMEAQHYFEAKSGSGVSWTVVPDLGRTLSGVALMPYAEKTDKAALIYKVRLDPAVASVRLRVVFSCTLPFKNGGQSVAAAFDGGGEKSWNINDQLTWKNNYNKMYPAAAARIIETEVEMPVGKGEDGVHTLVLRPLDPGVVFEKVIVDCGGYESTHLKMQESPYKR